MTEEIQILKDFVEGKMEALDFEQQLYTDSSIEKLLSDPELNWHGTYLQNTSAFLYLSELNYKSIPGRLNAQGTVNLFLTKKGIGTKPATKYSDDFDFLLSTSPKYIDADSSFIEKHILPKDKTLSKAARKQFAKQQYADLFKFQTKPPKWIQNPNWPIKEDKPLFFLGQVEIKNCEFFHDNGSIYLFIDTQTGAVETIKQFY